VINQQLLEETQQEKVLIEVKRQKWTYIGHTLWKASKNLAKETFNYNVQERPATIWQMTA
jgi:hypothetical protein